MCVCARRREEAGGQHSPYSIPLVERRDHGRWMFGHKSHQQLENVVDVLILPTKEGKIKQVRKGGRGSAGQKERC